MTRLGFRSLSLLALLTPGLALGAPHPGGAEVNRTADRAVERQSGDDAMAEPTVTSAGQGRYGAHTDEALTALAADWDSLDRHQRRALLTEMKLRMARNGDRKGVIHIRTERRYGRIIRQSDGRVIRIETQVVHVRPADPEDLKARQSFGVGFEHRIGRRGEDATEVGAGAPEAAGPDAATRESEVAGSDGRQAPALDSVLDSLTPSTQAPEVNRLPVYQVSEPKR